MVQYFQFDSAENMYIFAPGAGCTGETKIVRPGDELFLASSCNPNDWTSNIVTKAEAHAPIKSGLLLTYRQVMWPLPISSKLHLARRRLLS